MGASVGSEEYNLWACVYDAWPFWSDCPFCNTNFLRYTISECPLILYYWDWELVSERLSLYYQSGLLALILRYRTTPSKSAQSPPPNAALNKHEWIFKEDINNMTVISSITRTWPDSSLARISAVQLSYVVCLEGKGCTPEKLTPLY